jgi:hypothetical protein
VKLLGFSQRAESARRWARKCPGLDAVIPRFRLFLGEPPDAIKHVRWCERGLLQSRSLLDLCA